LFERSYKNALTELFTCLVRTHDHVQYISEAYTATYRMPVQQLPKATRA